MTPIEAEVLQLWGEITAATHRFLELIAELDDSGRWEGAGMASCARWLNLHCGIGDVAAREKLRIAHAIRDLPKINEAFRRGQVSYSKVRAMTRVATPENEDILLNIARHGAASHVERTVRQFRRVERLEAAQLAAASHRRRSVRYRRDEDESLLIDARLPPEIGAMTSAASPSGRIRSTAAGAVNAWITASRSKRSWRRGNSRRNGPICGPMRGTICD